MDAIDDIAALVEAHRDHLLLAVTGFDGVLAAYQADPGRVRLSAKRCAMLDTLGDCPGVALALVSGRRVSELRQCVSLGSKTYYLGLHGLEAEGPDFRMAERQLFDSCRGSVDEIAALLTPVLSAVAGVRVENKDAAIAVHTREAGSRDAVWARVRLLSAAATLAHQDELRLFRGSHVLELIPNIDRPRATAIAGLRDYLEIHEGRPVFTLYIAEDLPDDDAFDAIPGAGTSVAVGDRAPKARFHLASPADVWRLIERLAAGRMRREYP